MMKQKFILDINPANGEIFEKIKCSSSSEIASGVKLAKKALKTWKDTPLKIKISSFKKIARDFLEEKDSIARTITMEMGKVYKDALEEIEQMVKSMENNIEIASQALTIETSKGKGLVTEIHREPVGVVAVLTTWSSPISIPESLLSPAIIAGNAVVFKPSENTPLCGKIIYEIYNRHLPKGVINIIQGAEEVSLILLNSDIDMITFVGKKDIGKNIMSLASRNLNRIILELGGKNAMIVLKDANLEKAAIFAVKVSIKNAGQSCDSIERIYVEEKIYDKFEKLVLKEIKKYKAGDGFDKVDLGPIVNDEHRNFIISQIEEVRRKGAKILFGGNKINHKGYFLEPTLISDLSNKFDIMTKVTFGPVVCLQKVKSSDEAIEKVNDSEYGLGVSIWTSKKEKAMEIAKKIESGMIGINNNIAGVFGTPWLGRKESGYSFVGSVEGFKNFTQIKKITYSK